MVQYSAAAIGSRHCLSQRLHEMMGCQNHLISRKYKNVNGSSQALPLFYHGSWKNKLLPYFGHIWRGVIVAIFVFLVWYHKNLRSMNLYHHAIIFLFMPKPPLPLIKRLAILVRLHDLRKTQFAFWTSLLLTDWYKSVFLNMIKITNPACTRLCNLCNLYIVLERAYFNFKMRWKPQFCICDIQQVLTDCITFKAFNQQLPIARNLMGA